MSISTGPGRRARKYSRDTRATSQRPSESGTVHARGPRPASGGGSGRPACAISVRSARIERRVAAQPQREAIDSFLLLRDRRVSRGQRLRGLRDDLHRVARRELVDVEPPQHAGCGGECDQACNYGEIDLEIEALHGSCALANT
jgi:hypothetical protein